MHLFNKFYLDLLILKELTMTILKNLYKDGNVLKKMLWTNSFVLLLLSLFFFVLFFFFLGGGGGETSLLFLFLCFL